jgi:hypothetical protein
MTKRFIENRVYYQMAAKRHTRHTLKSQNTLQVQVLRTLAGFPDHVVFLSRHRLVP